MGIIKKINRIKEKYFVLIETAILVIALTLLGLAEIYPILKQFLLETGAISFVILAILLDIASYVIKINSKLEMDKTKIYCDEDSAETQVRQYIVENKPRKADLLEYSSQMASNIIFNLKKYDCQIRLLICHPDNANSEWQKKRIENRIRSLIECDLYNYKNAEIRCYRNYSTEDEEYDVFPSIKGRKFDEDFICIGWYTPTKKIKGGLNGHENPMICAYLKNEEGRILQKHFDEIFALLWDTAAPIEGIYSELKKQDSPNSQEHNAQSD